MEHAVSTFRAITSISGDARYRDLLTAIGGGAEPGERVGLAGGFGGMGDNLDHEAVGIEEEGGVTVRAILRERLRCTHYLVAAVPSPFVDTMHMGSRGNQKRQVLESYVLPRIVQGTTRRV